MSGKIHDFDEWLLTRHESVSHRVQKLTGHTCFQQARIITIIAFPLAIYYASYGKDAWQLKILLTVSVDALLYALTYFLSLQAERLHGSSRGRFANSLRSILERDRLLFVLFAVTACVMAITKQNGIAGSVAQLLLVNAIYLVSCTPLPPSRGRIREFLSTLRSHRDPIHHT